MNQRCRLEENNEGHDEKIARLHEKKSIRLHIGATSLNIKLDRLGISRSRYDLPTHSFAQPEQRRPFWVPVDGRCQIRGDNYVSSI